MNKKGLNNSLTTAGWIQTNTYRFQVGRAFNCAGNPIGVFTPPQYEQIGNFGKVLYGDWVNVPSNTDTLQILNSFTIPTSGVYMISGNMNYINTAPVLIEISEPVNHGRMMSRYDNSEYLNANYTAVVEYFEAGQVVSVRGRWATNAAECRAHMTVIRIV